MSSKEKEALLVASAVYEWNNKNVQIGFVFNAITNLTVNHIQQLAHFAKQGVKVKLK